MSSGVGSMINKSSMEGTTGSPTIRVEIYNQTYNIRSDATLNTSSSSPNSSTVACARSRLAHSPSTH